MLVTLPWLEQSCAHQVVPSVGNTLMGVITFTWENTWLGEHVGRSPVEFNKVPGQLNQILCGGA